MKSGLIHDRGRGPEIVGTRITVDNLLPHFLDPEATEAFLCDFYDLTPAQVAAARAYVLNHPDQVLAEHLRIEARIAAGNPPEVVEQAQKTRAELQNFRKWLVEREAAEAREDAEEVLTPDDRDRPRRIPTFREWLEERESRPARDS